MQKNCSQHLRFEWTQSDIG